MEGFDATTYGERFADVYDEWYHDVSDVESTVTTLAALAESGDILELGVGTGRLAIPLARVVAHRGQRVVGLDASPKMLDRLAQRDVDRLVVPVESDMVDGLPEGPFTLVFVAYNTLFNLTSAPAQQACFDAVAARLAPDGRFVVEAFIPDDPAPDGDDISVRSMSIDRVVLSISRHDASGQTAAGQFVEFTDEGGIRLRPWSIRYSTPDELDQMAAAAGLRLESRWASFDRTQLSPDAARHVTVYRPA